MAAELVLEPVLLEAERERKESPQPLAEAGHGGVVLVEERAQLGRPRRPAETGHRRTPVERLLQVTRSGAAYARCEPLAAERPVRGQARRRRPFREPAFLLLGKVEERMGGGARLLHQLLRDAVSDDGQEADLTARTLDLVDDAGTLRGDVDHGNAHVESL